MQSFAELLDFVDTKGLPSLSASDVTASLPQKWLSTLTTLSYSVPLNAMLADSLLERVNAAFAVHLRTFQDALQAAESKGDSKATQLSVAEMRSALEALCAAYDEVFSILQTWCEALRVPGLASLFSVQVRCALLQADILSGEEPPRKHAFFGFLRRYGHELLSRDPYQSSAIRGSSDRRGAGEEEDDENDGHIAARSTAAHASASTGVVVVDPVIACLHRLTLSQSNEMKQLWRSVLEARICEKLRDLSDDFSTHFLREQMTWLERCVIPFVTMVLDVDGLGRAAESPSADAATSPSWCSSTPVTSRHADKARYAAATAKTEQEAWCAEMRHLFLYNYARRRLDRFWEILSDYPDSIPALEDMHYCLQSNPESGLKTELMQTVRHLLSSRLHRAGTRTEDILAILINTIHAFCILFPRNEQNGVVFAVISDTLDHLRKRRDCVTAIVQAVMQPNGAMNAATPPPPPLPPLASQASSKPGGADASLHSGAGDEALGLFDGLVNGTAGGRAEEGLYRTSSRDRPDVLRVLLTYIHRRVLVEEYQHMLAEQLLQKHMHEFDTTPEEEVLERLKQAFGETVLDKCAVMVRDIQMSRRLTQQLREQLAQRGMNARAPGVARAAAMLPPSSASVSVLSMTTWPPLARCSAVSAGDCTVGAAAAGAAQTSPLKYRPHPSLQAEMDRLAEAYKRLKSNQRLAWLPSLGRVEVELTQRDPAKGNALVTVSQVLSVFDASVVLFVKERTISRSGSGGVAAAVALGDVAKALEVTAEELRPHVQHLIPTVLVMPTSETVAMQLSVATSSDVVFVEDTATSEADTKPAGLSPERVKLIERMVTSLLKTRGPQTSSAIHSSLKLLAKFEGTNADLLELLQSFIKRRLIVLNDAKLYALPPK